jgi:hypothetical protein
MNDSDGLRALGSRLRALVESSPNRPEDLERWHHDADAFRRYLASDHATVAVPHFVSHYLSDADIRVKDAGYRVTQDKAIQKVIAAFERGEIPEEGGLSLAPWGIVIVLAVLFLVYLALR